MALPTVQLASQSPRRRMLLEACALDVRVLKQEGDETGPVAHARRGDGGASTYQAQRGGNAALTTRLLSPILPSGLMVTRWASPHDTDDATRMLRGLSGQYIACFLQSG